MLKANRITLIITSIVTILPMLIGILAVGLVGSFRDTFTTIIGLVVALLYPGSLALVALFESRAIDLDNKYVDEGL